MITNEDEIFTERSDQVRNVQFPFPPLLLVVADRKRFNKMMRILSSKEESWRRRANNSEGD